MKFVKADADLLKLPKFSCKLFFKNSMIWHTQ